MSAELTKPTVYQCIAKVQAELAKEGIGKGRKNVQQGYNFRGIDDVYNALASILADVGLVIVPSYETREVVERESKSGGALFYITVKGLYQLISAHDGSKVSAGPFWGEAMDSGDKATNKAMSAAYKYMAMQVFAIPTKGDNDADQTTHEVKHDKVGIGTKVSLDRMPIERQKMVNHQASRIVDAFNTKQADLAFALYEDSKTVLDTDELAALRGLLIAEHKTALRTMAAARDKSQIAAMAGARA